MSHSMKLLRHLWNAHRGTSSLLKRISLEKDDVMIKILLLLPQKTQIKAKKERHDSDALSSSKQKSIPHSEQPIEDMPMPDDMNISDSEDTDTAHLPNIKAIPN
ncbi:hypothetical protein Tco_0815075 [Tanacetum coccineum]